MYGCEDCGGTWKKKRDVPVACRPYTVPVRRNPQCVGGYEATGNTWDIDWGEGQ